MDLLAVLRIADLAGRGGLAVRLAAEGVQTPGQLGLGQPGGFPCLIEPGGSRQ